MRNCASGNLEIPGSCFARPGMTPECFPRNDTSSDAVIRTNELLRLHHRKQERWGDHIGVSNDIVRRIFEHRNKVVPGFASKYNITRLVWFEMYDDPISAISREKELKKWKRSWKIQLIEAENPQWNDLYDSICT